jgi:hypothetical protein
VSGPELIDVFYLSNDARTSASHLVTLLLGGRLCSSNLLVSSSWSKFSAASTCTLDATLEACFVLRVLRILTICYFPFLTPPSARTRDGRLERSKLARSKSCIFPFFSNISTIFIFYLPPFLALRRLKTSYKRKRFNFSGYFAIKMAKTRKTINSRITVITKLSDGYE